MIREHENKDRQQLIGIMRDFQNELAAMDPDKKITHWDGLQEAIYYFDSCLTECKRSKGVL